MTDNEKNPPDSSAVEEALSKIPGLADQVGSEPKGSADHAGAEEPAEGQESEGVAPNEREPVEDSEAVQAALNQIPGLRDRTQGS